MRARSTRKPPKRAKQRRRRCNHEPPHPGQVTQALSPTPPSSPCLHHELGQGEGDGCQGWSGPSVKGEEVTAHRRRGSSHRWSRYHSQPRHDARLPAPPRQPSESPVPGDDGAASFHARADQTTPARDPVVAPGFLCVPYDGTDLGCGRRSPLGSVPACGAPLVGRCEIT